MDFSLLGISVAALAIERISYVWISCWPKQFVRILERVPRVRTREPWEVVRSLFVGFKFVQGAVFATWFVTYPDGPLFRLRSPAMATLAITIILVGQWLNIRVFHLLGRVGAFYGSQFGERVPWMTAFPFSMIAHPQYVGATLTVWGMFLLMLFPYPGWWAIPLLETAYYAAGARLESSTGECVTDVGGASAAGDVAAARYAR